QPHVPRCASCRTIAVPAALLVPLRRARRGRPDRLGRRDRQVEISANGDDPGAAPEWRISEAQSATKSTTVKNNQPVATSKWGRLTSIRTIFVRRSHYFPCIFVPKLIHLQGQETHEATARGVLSAAVRSRAGSGIAQDAG